MPDPRVTTPRIVATPRTGVKQAKSLKISSFGQIQFCTQGVTLELRQRLQTIRRKILGRKRPTQSNLNP